MYQSKNPDDLQEDLEMRSEKGGIKEKLLLTEACWEIMQ